MVAWVEGRPLREHDPQPVGHFRRIGELAAGIRRHNQHWSPPDGFDRRRWDTDGFVGEAPLWGRFWEADDLTAEQREVLATTRDALRVDLAALSIGPDRFGLIHADLHTANVMADGDRLTIIDFDDAGYGWYAHELAVALFDRRNEDDVDEARRLLLEGYRSVHPLDDEEAATIDTFLIVRHCMLIGWLDHRKDLEGYDEFFPQMADDSCAAVSAWLGRRLA
jgi:Ser/Thr protein kinase RdoA (MazF antagonist)